MTTQNLFGIKLRPIRTDFWRKKSDQTFSRGDLTGRLLKGAPSKYQPIMIFTDLIIIAYLISKPLESFLSSDLIISVAKENIWVSSGQLIVCNFPLSLFLVKVAST